MTTVFMLVCGADSLEQDSVCKLPVRRGGARATLEMPVRAGRWSPQGNARALCTILARLMQSDRGGTCQHRIC